MSQLDELIAEFCPNGVEYKTIDEIAVDIYRGWWSVNLWNSR